jgi:hypothetical protein
LSDDGGLRDVRHGRVVVLATNEVVVDNDDDQEDCWFVIKALAVMMLDESTHSPSQIPEREVEPNITISFGLASDLWYAILIVQKRS